MTGLHQLSYMSGPIFSPSQPSPGTLTALIDEGIASHPEGSIVEINGGGALVRVGYAALHARALDILAYLRRRVSQQDTVVLCFDSVLDFIPAVWACVYGGFTCTPRHISALGHNDRQSALDVRRLAERLGRHLTLTTDELAGGVLGSAISDGNGRLLTVDTIPDLDPSERREAGDALARTNGVDGGRFLLATSGTESAPKFAEISHDAFLQRSLLLREFGALARALFVFPFDGITGFRILLPGAGQHIYFQPDRLASQPLDVFAQCEALNVDTLPISPSFAAWILAAIRRGPRTFDLSSLRSVSFGAEPVDTATCVAFLRCLESLGARLRSVSTGFGMTETGPVVRAGWTSSTEAIRAFGDKTRTPALGTCLPGWSLRIVDDRGRAVAQGVEGHLQVHCAERLFSGYHGDAEATDRSFTADGWFRTGDIGVVEDGALRVTGRDKETIIANAKKIPLARIEESLIDLEGIRDATVIAAALRPADAPSDELAVFFLPRSRNAGALDLVCRAIKRRTAPAFGIAAKHLVPIEETDIERTRTGKLRRGSLVERLLSGDLLSHVVTRPDDEPEGGDDVESHLAALWRDILGLDRPPGGNDDFYDLGGDSLAAASLIATVEAEFKCRIPLAAFFDRPTIGNLVRFLQTERRRPAAAPANQDPLVVDDLLHRIQSYTASWQGTRLFSDSLVLGANTGGSKPAIFWVFQDEREFRQLAAQLGSDQPLYAMRSFAGIVRARDYTADLLDTAGNRYLWEILALPVEHPVILGGNCQGAIVALALARRLKQIGRTPLHLVLMEWSYSYGRYAEPVRLIYGRQSRVAAYYTGDQASGPDWRRDFPNNRVMSIPGNHGQFFRDENVGELAKAITMDKKEAGVRGRRSSLGGQIRRLFRTLPLSGRRSG